MISTISEAHTKKLGFKIKTMDRFLDKEGTGGRQVPYNGYVEVQLNIPGTVTFKEDVLMLVTDDSRCTQRVPVAIGTLHINWALDLVTDEEIEQLSTEWKRGRLSTLLTLTTSQLIEAKINTFNLDQVRGNVKHTKSITLNPFESIHVSRLSKVKDHHKRVHVVTEPPTKPFLKYVLVATAFTTMNGNLGREDVALRNFSA